MNKNSEVRNVCTLRTLASNNHLPTQGIEIPYQFTRSQQTERPLYSLLSCQEKKNPYLTELPPANLVGGGCEKEGVSK